MDNTRKAQIFLFGVFFFCMFFATFKTIKQLSTPKVTEGIRQASEFMAKGVSRGKN